MDFGIAGTAKTSMVHYIESMSGEDEVRGTVNTPAEDNVFVVDSSYVLWCPQ